MSSSTATVPVSYSVGSAASALIGEALGQGDHVRATRVLDAACTLTLLPVLCYAVPLCASRQALASLFSGGVAEVEHAYLRALPLVLTMHLLDGLFNVYKAWLTVRKQQAFGAVMSLVIYYCVGVPLGFWLVCEQTLDAAPSMHWRGVMIASSTLMITPDVPEA